MKNWASMPLRLGLGIIFIYHGLQKAFGLFGGHGINGFSNTLSGLGFSPATPLAYLVAYIELIGGLFLILGLLARIVSILFIAVMTVAILNVHLPNGFSVMQGGYEYSLIIICACMTLILTTPSKFSITKKL